MAKRQIDFIGPSVKDLGIEDVGENNGITKYGNTIKGNTKNGNTDINKNNSPQKQPSIIQNKGITKNGNTKNANTENRITKKHYNTVQFKLIRDYLYNVLGKAERVEIKLSVMCQELEINPKTFYKHLKTLRESEFVITKLQYSTEVKKK